MLDICTRFEQLSELRRSVLKDIRESISREVNYSFYKGGRKNREKIYTTGKKQGSIKGIFNYYSEQLQQGILRIVVNNPKPMLAKIINDLTGFAIFTNSVRSKFRHKFEWIYKFNSYAISCGN